MPVAGHSHRGFTGRSLVRSLAPLLLALARENASPRDAPARVRVSSHRAYLVDVVHRACAIGINVLAGPCVLLDGWREFKAWTSVPSRSTRPSVFPTWGRSPRDRRDRGKSIAGWTTGRRLDWTALFLRDVNCPLLLVYSTLTRASTSGRGRALDRSYRAVIETLI